MCQQYWNLTPFLCWLPYASEAVFPWYVLHQSATVLLAYWLVPMQLGPRVEATVVVLGTIATCALLHEGVIRRVAVLRPLFGLKRRSTAVLCEQVQPHPSR